MEGIPEQEFETPRNSLSMFRVNKLKVLEKTILELNERIKKLENYCSYLIEENKVLKSELEQPLQNNSPAIVDEEVAEETGWILQKSRKSKNKKRRASTSPVVAKQPTKKQSNTNNKKSLSELSTLTVTSDKNLAPTSPLQNKHDSCENNSIENIEYNTDEEELAAETNWIVQRNKKKSKNKNQIAFSSPLAEVESIASQDKQPINKRLPPPIVVSGIKCYKDMYSMLKDISKEEISLKLINNDVFKIFPNNGEDYRKITKQFNELKLPWYSFEIKENRPIKVVVKNLHHSCDTNEIIEDLKDQGLKPISAENKLKWKSKEPLDIFILSFESSEDIKRIYNIKSILNCIVKVEPIKKSRLILQCKNCQLYGHTKNFCSKPPRCVKCAGKHKTMECTKPSSQKPKCYNCGESHPASYRGCVVAKELQKLKDKSKRFDTQSINRTPKNLSVAKAKTPQRQQKWNSFSNVLKKKPDLTYSSNTDNENLLSEILKTLKTQEKFQQNIELRLSQLERAINN